MSDNHFIKNSALSFAMILTMISVSGQAEGVSEISANGSAGELSLATLPTAAADSEQRGDDLKLSPYLYQIKTAGRQDTADQPGRLSRSKRSFQQNEIVNLDITIQGGIDEVRGELSEVGFTAEAIYGNNIGGTIATDKLGALSKIARVKRINMPIMATNAGAVENQADFLQLSKKVRSSLKNAPTGKGLTIGIMSNSFNCFSKIRNPDMGDVTAEDDVNNGELPNDVYVVRESSECSTSINDEGRAMAQLVHDIAPDAKIAFYAPASQTDFAQGVQTLALPKGQFDAFNREGAGADIIVDDLYYYDEPFYETGIIGDSITQAVKKGVAYFVPAGNTSRNENGRIYHNNKPKFLTYSPTQESVFSSHTAQILQIGDSESDTTLPVNLTNDTTQSVGIWWDQSYVQGNQSEITACLTRADGKRIDKSNWCMNQPLGHNPMILMNFNLPDGLPDGLYGIQLFYNSGTVPGSITVLGYGKVSMGAWGTPYGTIHGHSSTLAAFTVGAADFASTPQCNAEENVIKMEPFSSYGNSPLLFDTQGKPDVVVPNKPDATAIDGVSTSFFGRKIPDADELPVFKHADCNYTSDYAFYGTSAAAPNAAAVAALIMQDNPGITPKELYEVMRQSATTIGEKPTDGKYNYVSGYGLINAEKAIVMLREKRGQ